MRRYAVRRTAIAALMDSHRDLMAGVDDPDDVLDRHMDTVADIRARLAGDSGFDLARLVSEEIHLLEDPDYKGRRWSTGVDVLDEMTAGFQAGTNWVIGGRSRHGKTSLVVTATGATLAQGLRVLQLRYEETEGAIVRRIVSQSSGLPYSAAQRGTLRPDERAEFAAALDAFARETGDRLYIATNPTRGEAEMLIREHRPDLLILDTLQKAAHAIGGQGDRHDLLVGRITGWLAGLALDHNLCSVIVSQISRRSGTGLPTTIDLRESGAIEEDADVVVLVCWPWIDDRTLDRDRYLLSVAKNRPGGITSVRAVQIAPETQVLTTLPEWEEVRFKNSLGGDVL